MIRLDTLGTLELREDDGRILRSVLSRPKRLAVLAYLVLARPYGVHRRDSLLAIFWPESPESRARHALNQTLYVLRKALGAEVLVTDSGDGVGVSPDHVSCDAWDLVRALEEGRPADAIAVYGGELLAGFHLTGSRPFDAWLERERSGLRTRVVTAARDLAAEREAAGNPVGAIRVLRTAAAISPYDATLRSELVRLLAGAGDRAGALREYEDFAARLEEDLELSPPDAMATLVASLREEATELREEATDARQPAPGSALSASRPPGPVLPSRREPSPSPTDRPRRRPPSAPWMRGALVSFLGAALLLGAGTAVWLGSGEGSDRAVAGPAGEFVRIAVLPFQVRGDQAEIGYLRQGVPELLGRKLDGVGPIRVVDAGLVGDTSRPLPGDAPIRRAVSVAGDGSVPAYLLTGSVVEAGGQLEIRASLLDSLGVTKAEVIRRARDEAALFGTVDQVARALVATLHREPPDRLAGLAARTTSSLPALKSYLGGEEAFRNARYGRAVDAFRQAVEDDSTFALAWYRLAMAEEWAAAPTDPEATRQALRLANRLPPRERRLLEAWQAYRSRSWEEAERHYARLVADYPDEIEGWIQLAEVRYHGGWLRGRALDEARGAFERVLHLDPDHEGALLHLTRIAALKRQTTDLEQLAEHLNDLSPASTPALEARALRAVVEGGRAGLLRAAEELRELHRLHGDRLVAPAWTVFYATGPEAVRTLAPALLEWNHPDVRAGAHLLLALEYGARGRWNAAEDRIRRARPFNPVWAAEVGRLWSMAPFRSGGDHRGTRGQTARGGGDGSWTAEREPSRGGAKRISSGTPASRAKAAADAFLVGHIRLGLDDDLGRYLDALEDAASGNVAGALATARAFEEAGGPLLPALATGLRAEALRRTEGPNAALGAFEGTPLSRPYEGGWISPFWALSRERWLRAELLRESGRPEEALRLYASFDDGPVWDLVYRAPSYLRRARIHDELGNADRAADHYRRFLALWTDPDSELEPVVELARRRLRALDD